MNGELYEGNFVTKYFFFAYAINSPIILFARILFMPRQRNFYFDLL